jgi:hypothetical protein
MQNDNSDIGDRLRLWCEAHDYGLSWNAPSATVDLPKDVLRRALGLTFFRDGTFQSSIYVTDNQPSHGRDHCYYRDRVDQPTAELEARLNGLVEEARQVSIADLGYLPRSARG